MALEFTPLLSVLILLSLLKGFAVGNPLLPDTTGTGYRNRAPDCLVQVGPGFPEAVNINVSIISTNRTARVVHDVSKRSTSPWDYSINEDPNRFPSKIAEAKCHYFGCVDALGQENHSMTSVPIRQQILVLRRKYKGCEQTYQLEKLWVTVGCTCARPLSNASPLRKDQKN
ncbi:interleukin-17A-like [Eublepharis macularius]|uniref:Interleukin-17A-like n=1 Tax=Eublepharis macularius TaxID=481883 RepID=A0AA97IVV6_EUBMA|nr:interleukin-17A-like [Eublepharis macularius]